MVRAFTQSDQQQFAILSGDCNPAHLDPVYARRLPNGRPIVHGMHLVLWALESAAIGLLGSLKQLDAQFKSPVLVGDEVHGKISRTETGHLELILSSNAEVATIVRIWAGESIQDSPDVAVRDSSPESVEISQLTLQDLPKACGEETLQFSRPLFSELFPKLSQKFSPGQAAILLALTRVVGMHCPGLDSLLYDMSLTFQADSNESRAFVWRVDQVDERFFRVDMNLGGRCWNGRVSAFLRPPIKSQPSMIAVAQKVAATAFLNQRAFVVGGTRGLGECAAKILAAGGAEVAITYKNGLADAGRVVAEVLSQGGKARHQYWDVLDESTFADEGWAPTHLYYFATPPIFVGNRRAFSPSLFSVFCDFYVVGFLKTLNYIVERMGSTSLRTLYPSSVALDQIPLDLGEYAAAKAAGEAACRYATRKDPRLSILIERLPRVETDQTASLVPSKTQQAIDILIPILQSIATREP